VEEIYQAYPRKVGKKAALAAIRRACRTIPAQDLLAFVQRYATARDGQDAKYTPLPATWFNQGRWMDDPANWKDDPGEGKPKAKRKKVPGDPDYHGSKEYYEELDRRRKEAG
jgi:hypothetical protein